MERINTRKRFIEFAREIDVRPDWHEPDEQNLTARVEGLSFNNAGGVATHTELHVIFSELTIDDDGVRDDIACVNLATLCAWATGLTD